MRDDGFQHEHPLFFFHSSNSVLGILFSYNGRGDARLRLSRCWFSKRELDQAARKKMEGKNKAELLEGVHQSTPALRWVREKSRSKKKKRRRWLVTLHVWEQKETFSSCWGSGAVRSRLTGAEWGGTSRVSVFFPIHFVACNTDLSMYVFGCIGGYRAFCG